MIYFFSIANEMMGLKLADDERFDDGSFHGVLKPKH